jgi:hypothetical protein
VFSSDIILLYSVLLISIDIDNSTGITSQTFFSACAELPVWWESKSASPAPSFRL